MRIVLWVLRALAMLLLIRLILRALFPGRRGSGSRGPAGGTGRVERAGGELVRCEACGTYVPKDRAVVSSGGSARHFCTPACRDGQPASARGPETL